jgi:hypothetical protein
MYMQYMICMHQCMYMRYAVHTSVHVCTVYEMHISVHVSMLACQVYMYIYAVPVSDACICSICNMLVFAVRMGRHSCRHRADTEQTQSRHRADIEQTQSRHRADTEQTQSRHRADTEQTQSRHAWVSRVRVSSDWVYSK